MKVYCILMLPSGFIDEYCFQDWENFCQFKEKNQDIKYGKPRFDTEFMLGRNEE